MRTTNVWASVAGSRRRTHHDAWSKWDDLLKKAVQLGAYVNGAALLRAHVPMQYLLVLWVHGFFGSLGRCEYKRGYDNFQAAVPNLNLQP